MRKLLLLLFLLSLSSNVFAKEDDILDCDVQGDTNFSSPIIIQYEENMINMGMYNFEIQTINKTWIIGTSVDDWFKLKGHGSLAINRITSKFYWSYTKIRKDHTFDYQSTTWGNCKNRF